MWEVNFLIYPQFHKESRPLLVVSYNVKAHRISKELISKHIAGISSKIENLNVVNFSFQLSQWIVRKFLLAQENFSVPSSLQPCGSNPRYKSILDGFTKMEALDETRIHSASDFCLMKSSSKCVIHVNETRFP